MIRKSFLIILAGLVSALHQLPAQAAGENYRRLAVELALISGDSRILLKKSLSIGKRQWIEKRLAGSLNQMELIARQYLSSSLTKPDHTLLEQIHALQYLKNDIEQLHQTVTRLSELYPVSFAYKLDTVLSPALEKKVQKNYQELCYGCHIGPTPEKSVVIGSLSNFARDMSSQEWLARLLGGLHGDVFTRYENPFSDSMILLFHLYIKEM